MSDLEFTAFLLRNEERAVVLGKQQPSAILMGNSIQLSETCNIVLITMLRRNYSVTYESCQVQELNLLTEK